MSDLTVSVNATAGYYNNRSAADRFYIGEDTTSGTDAGDYISYMGFVKPTFTQSIKVLSMELKVCAVKSTSGYNGCYASINYVGGTKSNTVLHTFSGTITLSEYSGGWRTYTTSTIIDRDYLRTILLDSSTPNMWFKLQRTSGMGIVLSGYSSSNKPTLTITYKEGNEIKYYTSGAWHNAEPYVYTNGVWQPANIELYTNETWKS